MALCLSAFCAEQPDTMKYYDMAAMPLYGTVCPDASARYSRLPDSLQSHIRKELWDLGLNSAGLAVRFRSNSPALVAKWKSRNKFAMNHMTPTGIRGLDMYVLQGDTTWTTLSSVRPQMNTHNNRATVITDMTPGEMREYMLYLSLYDGVDSLYVGIDSAAVLLPPAIDTPVRQRPVVMYGTSILQGGCATRPGMAHTNILQRMLGREVINLGFSGNARLDPEIADLMAGVDASLFVVDALPNCSSELVAEKMADFIGTLRRTHPTTPILLVESPMFPLSRFNNEVRTTLTEKNRTLRGIYDNLVAAGDSNLHYFDASRIMGDEYEGTVDNYHLTDLGFDIFARNLYPVINSLINNR